MNFSSVSRSSQLPVNGAADSSLGNVSAASVDQHASLMLVAAPPFLFTRSWLRKPEFVLPVFLSIKVRSPTPSARQRETQTTREWTTSGGARVPVTVRTSRTLPFSLGSATVPLATTTRGNLMFESG